MYGMKTNYWPSCTARIAQDPIIIFLLADVAAVIHDDHQGWLHTTSSPRGYLRYICANYYTCRRLICLPLLKI